MNCEERQLAISTMIDNECPEAELQEVFTHLSTCASCRRFYREAMELRTRLHRERMPAVSSSLDARVLGHAQEPKILQLPLWLTSRVAVPAPLAAAALLLIILGTFSLLTQRPMSNSSLAQQEVVYVPTLPTVEVEGIIPNAFLRQ
jgi:predicted anti-sigma-YlaC factor YlaD